MSRSNSQTKSDETVLRAPFRFGNGPAAVMDKMNCYGVRFVDGRVLFPIFPLREFPFIILLRDEFMLELPIVEFPMLEFEL